MLKKFLIRKSLVIMIVVSLFVTFKPLPVKATRCSDAAERCLLASFTVEQEIYCALGYAWCVIFIGK